MKTPVAIVSIVTALAVQGPEGTAVLKGRVIDALSGKPLSGIALRAGYQRPYTPGGPPALPDHNMRTAADGTFEIGGLLAGDYEIHETNQNPGAGYLLIAYGVRRPGGASALLTVANGARLDITIRAWPAANISGRVIDERGHPVAGAAVRLLATPSTSYGSATTDARGVYRIGGLLPGRYGTFVPVVAENRTIKVWARLAAFIWPPGFPHVIDRDGRTVLFTHGAPLPPPSEDGRPTVFVSSYSGGGSRMADAGYVTLSTGEARGDVDITLRARTGRRVAGVASVASGSVAGVVVTLKLAGADDAHDYGHLMATAGSDGRFVFVAAPEGEYALTARRRGPLRELTLAGLREVPHDYTFEGTDGFGAEVPLTIGDRDIEGIAVHLAPGTRVAGRVIFEKESVGLQTAGIGAFLQLVEDPYGNDRRELTIAADGKLSGSMRPGRYFVHVHGARDGWSFKGATIDGRDIGDGPIVVGRESLDGLALVFSRDTTLLRGLIAARTGPPPLEIGVVAFSTNQERWPDARAVGTFRARSVAARDGSYEIRGLLPGEYFVVALDEHLPARELTLPILARLAEGSARVQLHAGRPVTLSLTPRSITP
jgi:Carboxypeptidase regulatory-like domain